jgi:hypothetical protein
MLRSAGALTIACSVLACAAATAHDMWEASAIPECIDDAPTTCNQLMPGVPQVHDLQGAPPDQDRDFMLLETKARRSYEVDVRGSNFPFEGPTCTQCPEIRRVNAAGTVLTTATFLEPVHTLTNTVVRGTVRWTGGAADQRDYIRVTGPPLVTLGAGDRYEIMFRDTTLLLPRWNNSATQTTVLLIANHAPHAVTGTVNFYDNAGALVHGEQFTIARSGTRVMSTAAISALAGNSGSATVTHNGGYGELAGKAAALEPATGFTFDTQMTYVPY